MYTYTTENPTGCSSDAGYDDCANCVFQHDPLGCDAFCTEENAQKHY